MSYIVVSRNPKTNKALVVTDEDGELAEYATENEASDAANETTVCKAWGFEVVEIS